MKTNGKDNTVLMFVSFLVLLILFVLYFLFFSSPAFGGFWGMTGTSLTTFETSECRSRNSRQLYRALLFDTYTSPPDRAAFGPYARPVKDPMEMHSGFSPEAGYHISDSALCGTCHILYTPTVDEAGNVIGEFPEQTTYLEWQHSESLNDCQTCHLPKADGPVAISNRPGKLSLRQPFGLHELAGGNSFMLDLLRDNRSQLGVTADASQLDAAIERTHAQLTNRTAALNLTSVSANQDSLELVLQVRNLAGHKTPTGIPCRRIWLHVTVADKTGKMVFESGKPQPDGSIARNDADLGAGFELHYDLITVQIYESIMADNKSEVTYTLLRGMQYVKDNRLLPPAGFDKTTASLDIGVRGSAADDQNFSAGRDLITYRINVKDAQRPFAVSADLLYQSLSYPFVQTCGGTTRI